MLCPVCHVVSPGPLCAACRDTLKPAPDRLLPGGIRVIAAFEHDGAAKTLVHHLKYRAVAGVADLVAELLADRLPVLPLAPVPRSFSRRLRYGVDGAREIALSLARRLDVPMLDLLAPPLHAPRRAGRDHWKPVARYRLRRDPPPQVLIVDDVVTTGATLMSAIAAVGPDRVRAAVAANVVSQPSNVTRRMTSPVARMDQVWQQF
ncbi:MAG TPA: hypothetical protein VFO17_12420 [Acidimicrobiia bacterium]|jgi:predicted amidophosphoribosyltransferase|nr:hypothetical protein [Acidimicrobiia bacterium]